MEKETLVVRSTLVEGSVPPHESRTRQGPVFPTLPKNWEKLKILQPRDTSSTEKGSAELVIDTYVRVGNPGSYLRAKILVDSGSRVPILFRRNFVQNLQPAETPIKMCTVSHEHLEGGSMGATLQMALPMALLPNSGGRLIEQKFLVKECV